MSDDWEKIPADVQEEMERIAGADGAEELYRHASYSTQRLTRWSWFRKMVSYRAHFSACIITATRVVGVDSSTQYPFNWMLPEDGICPWIPIAQDPGPDAALATVPQEPSLYSFTLNNMVVLRRDHYHRFGLEHGAKNVRVSLNDDAPVEKILAACSAHPADHTVQNDE